MESHLLSNDAALASLQSARERQALGIEPTYRPPMQLGSTLCRFEHFRSPWFQKWAGLIKQQTLTHRKTWEWAAIMQALSERGKLKPGSKGLGFAVGLEPLSCVFASFGCEVLATDFTTGDVANTWDKNGQNAKTLEAIHTPWLCEKSEFDRLVKFEHGDMTDLTKFERNSYDFLWSSCALEHVGSLEKGATFVRDAMDLLKPGGIAVHTTEYNVSSPTHTVEAGPNVIYRRSDLEKLDGELRLKRCGMEPFDLYAGHEPEDLAFDTHPYQRPVHVKLLLDGVVCTSVLLICRKA